jgi:hypothetical protein
MGCNTHQVLPPQLAAQKLLFLARNVDKLVLGGRLEQLP